MICADERGDESCPPFAVCVPTRTAQMRIATRTFRVSLTDLSPGWLLRSTDEYGESVKRDIARSLNMEGGSQNAIVRELQRDMRYAIMRAPNVDRG
jgi:hypothetical protein